MTKVYIVDNCDGSESWEKKLVGFEQESDGTWRAMTYTVSKFGGLRGGIACNHSDSLSSCMAAFERGIRHELGKGVTIGELVYDGAKFVSLSAEPCFYCDSSDESVHDNFKAWSASLFR